MGRMPAVLKMARQMNHANWSWRALFHRAISFQTPSQMATRMMTVTKSAVKGVFIRLLVLGFPSIVDFFINRVPMGLPALGAGKVKVLFTTAFPTDTTCFP